MSSASGTDMSIESNGSDLPCMLHSVVDIDDAVLVMSGICTLGFEA